MMDRSQLAREYFLNGANCAQAVLCAFAQECQLNETEAMRLASGFGGGMGRMREVCGAVSGMILVANILCGNGDKSDKKAKDAHYALIQKLAGKFREQNGSIICRELLGLEKNGPDEPVSEVRSKSYYQKRPCAELVALAAGIVEAELGTLIDGSGDNA